MSSTLRVPGYTLRRMVGDGATAVVYKARSIAENRDVAIKVLNPENAGDADAIKQFHLEFLAMSSLRHRNIVRVFAEGEVAGRPYVVMEYVGGYSVAEWLSRKGRLQEKDVLLIAESCMMALHHAWSAGGLVHADLKPANVLVDTDGTIKLTDFSGLRRGENIPSLFKDWVVGTPAYMSPEQWQAMEGLDARSDMYSLGAMMYHLACGKPPCGERPPDPHQPFVPPDYEPVRSVRPDFTRASSRVIERLLAVPVEKRFPDWNAALRALEETLPRSMRLDTAVVSGLPSPTAPHPSKGKNKKAEREQKKRVAPGTVLALLGFLILTGIVLLSLHARSRDGAPLSAGPADTTGKTVAVEQASSRVPEQAASPVPPAPLEPPAASEIADSGHPEISPDKQVPQRTPAALLDNQPVNEPDRQRDYMEIMNDTFQLARRRQFGEAREMLELRLQASPRLAEPYAGRLQQAAALLGKADAAFKGLAENPSTLLDLELEHTHNRPGRIVALEGEQLHVVHAFGQGEVGTFPMLRQVAEEDLWALMKAVYGKGAAANLAAVMIAEGQYEKARPFVSMAEKAEEEEGLQLRRWIELWQRAAINLRAYSALNHVRGLIERDQVKEARQALDRAKQLYRMTDVFTSLRAVEIDELEERIETALLELQREETRRDRMTARTPPISRPIVTLSPGQINRAYSSYDGRVINLRFRARGPIDQLSDDAPIETMLGDMDEWVNVRVHDENGRRWLRAIPVWDIQAEEQEVLARVHAQDEQLELVGTRTTGDRDAPDFTW